MVCIYSNKKNVTAKPFRCQLYLYKKAKNDDFMEPFEFFLFAVGRLDLIGVSVIQLFIVTIKA
jgi:hypothetical protein